MDDENSVPEDKQSVGNQLKNKAADKVKDKAADKLKNAIKSKVSKSVAQNAAKKSLIKVLMPILTYVFLFIIALVIIIGIVMFFITMPGMVMEQLKSSFSKIGSVVANLAGQDTTKEIDEKEIYNILDYLESMGYDLKGDGFLTDFVGDSDDGVERDDDDNIINAKSDFIRTYLISENYVYTIKNYNPVAGNFLERYVQLYLSRVTYGLLNSHWTRGMIQIYNELDYFGVGIIGIRGKEYGHLDWGSIKVDYNSKSLEIKFDNTVKYSLDGWTGRYGMPLEFLLSVHQATKMPDLAYDMATSFSTVINLYLHRIGGTDLTGENNTVTGYYRLSNGDYVSYDQFKEKLGSIVTSKDAKKIMDEFGIESPDDCTGKADLGDKTMAGNNKVNGGLSYDLEKDGGSGAVNGYNEMIKEMKANGYNPNSTSASLDEVNLFSDITSLMTNTNTSNFTANVNSANLIQATTNTGADTDPETQKDAEYVWEELSSYNDTIKWTGTYEENGKSYTCNYYAEINLNLKKGTQIGSGFSINDFFIGYEIKRELSDDEINDWLDEEGLSNPDEAKCSNTHNTEACDVCTEYIQSIYDSLKRIDVGSYDTYQPYIANVKDHWYRDVYFVAFDSSLPFGLEQEQIDQFLNKDYVDSDYDYESVMKERWTKYETYEDESADNYGEFKLYTLDGSLYPGTQEKADEEGIKVTKKAVTFKLRDQADDLNWNQVAGLPIYTAYEIDDQVVENFQQVEDENVPESIADRMYANIKTTGNIKQTGEGQRTETNAYIKKMFSENTYFRYDGSSKTAEIIAELRKNINGNDNYYGVLKGTTVNEVPIVGKEVSSEVDHLSGLTATVDGKTYKAEDFSGQVSFTQDSLNAFSMLENEHTLDADYIYRDFKELAVELGYFTKEELTDETPRLLQWIVPETGSGNYPKRAIDKRENEYGTMIHSEGDINAVDEVLLTNIINEMNEKVQDDQKQNSNTTSTESKNATNTQSAEQKNTANSTSAEQKNVSNVANGITSISAENKVKNEVGAISDDTTVKSPSSVSINELLETTREMCEYINKEGYDYCQNSGEAEDHSVHGNAHSLPTTFEDSKASVGVHNFCCATLISWALQNVKVLPDSAHSNSSTGLFDYIRENYDYDLIKPGEELKEGDIVFYDYDNSGDKDHIEMLGKKIDNGFEKFNGGHSVPVGAEEHTSSASIEISNGWDDGFIVALRLHWGNSRDSSEYTGYKGNQAVVSPVTGVLLEYGTYDKEVDSISNEEYRVNVDLKYGTEGLLGGKKETDKDNTANSNTTNTNTTSATNNVTTQNSQSSSQTNNPEEAEALTTVIDKVGYAKILVLDEENYKKLEAELLSSTIIGEDELLIVNDKKDDENKYNFVDLDLDEETLKDWKDLDNTVYGYKEFLEAYKKAGISGNIVYIDGFKCEKPDEEFEEEKEDEEKPHGEEITMSTFQDNITTASFLDRELSKEDEDNKRLESFYQADSKYKMASKKATEKLAAEGETKTNAAPTITVDDVTLIKEGTLIGRTLTDKELIEDYGDGARGTYEDNRKKVSLSNTEDDTDKVIGNYLRIIMRDKDQTVVENVEDYMKLDDGKNKNEKCEFEHLAYFLGCLEEGLTTDNGTSYGTTVLNDGAGNTTSFGLTKAVADLEGVKETYPQFGEHLANGSVDKKEAQDVFILTLEAAKETIQSKLTTPLEDDDSNLFALIDLHHAGPSICYDVIDVYNSKGNNMSDQELINLYSEHWGSNYTYYEQLSRRGRNRGLLAAQGRWFLYQSGQAGDEVIFDSKTPWTEFCEGGGTAELCSTSSGLYHIEKGADS